MATNGGDRCHPKYSSNNELNRANKQLKRASWWNLGIDGGVSGGTAPGLARRTSARTSDAGDRRRAK